MNAQEFAFWLQGYLEISGAKNLNEKELKIVRDHLALVFEKKTPEYWPNHLNEEPICSPLAASVHTVSNRTILDSPVAVTC